jgi:hypothetical protein
MLKARLGKPAERAQPKLNGAPLALTVANYGQLNVGQAQTNQAAFDPPKRTRRRRGDRPTGTDR